MIKVINKNELDKAARSLNKNNLVIFPTETVYGLGANALNYNAVDKIFAAKNRQSNNPLIVHLKDKNEIEKYATIENEIEQKLINEFMPGPFTLILRKKEIIPNNVTCNMDTVGIRIPTNPICHELLNMLDYPLAAPSANKSTKPSGTIISDIIDEFRDTVDYIIDGGETQIGLESTVVKVINNIPTILRPGYITKEMIEEKIGICNISEFILKEAKGRVESPGMLYKHYSPNTKCILVDKQLLEKTAKKYNNPIIIGNNPKIKNAININYGNTLEEISHNIFHLLRQADKLNNEIILIEATTINNIGLAIMNRLIRTCEYNYIKDNNENNKL